MTSRLYNNDDYIDNNDKTDRTYVRSINNNDGSDCDDNSENNWNSLTDNTDLNILKGDIFPSHVCIFLIDFILYLCRSGWSVLVWR
jgi:hypothetical protein